MKKTMDQRRHQAEWWLKMRGAIRRLTVQATTEVLKWAVQGAIDDEDNEESDDVEVFQNVGFASRPKSGQNAEVIVVNVGGAANHPVIVASRDEDTRRAQLADLAADETSIYNTQCLILLDSGGVVRLGSRGASESVLKGDAYRTAEDTYLGLVGAALTALSVDAHAVALMAGATITALAAGGTPAFSTFKAAADLAKSTKVKTD